MQRCIEVVVLAVLALSQALGTSAWATPVAEPLERPAIGVVRLDQVAFQAVTPAGDRLVAVGERGVIALSDDEGRSWRQANVPVSVGLTAVAFPTPTLGWAVGHYGVVLHSRDAGETWNLQLDGVQAAQVVADSLPASGGSRRVARLVEDGPDKPFLDLFFPSSREGFVIGAYGLMFHTIDGGKNWRSLTLDLPNPEGLHLYVVRAGGNALYVAGEQGFAMRSDDGGKNFRRLATPYSGSWFTAQVDNDGGVVLAGLRGNAFRSTDRGASWRAMALPAPVSVTAMIKGAGGALLLANQAGQVFIADSQGLSVAPKSLPALPTPTGIWVAKDGGMVIATLRGMRREPTNGDNVVAR